MSLRIPAGSFKVEFYVLRQLCACRFVADSRGLQDAERHRGTHARVLSNCKHRSYPKYKRALNLHMNILHTLRIMTTASKTALEKSSVRRSGPNQQSPHFSTRTSSSPSPLSLTKQIFLPLHAPNCRSQTPSICDLSCMLDGLTLKVNRVDQRYNQLLSHSAAASTA